MRRRSSLSEMFSLPCTPSIFPTARSPNPSILAANVLFSDHTRGSQRHYICGVREVYCIGIECSGGDKGPSPTSISSTLLHLTSNPTFLTSSQKTFAGAPQLRDTIRMRHRRIPGLLDSACRVRAPGPARLSSSLDNQ